MAVGPQYGRGGGGGGGRPDRGICCTHLWQSVTVALACRAIIAAGSPTMFERPSTTTCLPTAELWGLSGERVGFALSSDNANTHNE
eukprot:SAG11_NODE_1238_length_5425_cov_3.387908_6_plen_86_part_00